MQLQLHCLLALSKALTLVKCNAAERRPLLKWCPVPACEPSGALTVIRRAYRQLVGAVPRMS